MDATRQRARCQVGEAKSERVCRANMLTCGCDALQILKPLVSWRSARCDVQPTYRGAYATCAWAPPALEPSA